MNQAIRLIPAYMKSGVVAQIISAYQAQELDLERLRFLKAQLLEAVDVIDGELRFLGAEPDGDPLKLLSLVSQLSQRENELSMLKADEPRFRELLAENQQALKSAEQDKLAAAKGRVEVSSELLEQHHYDIRKAKDDVRDLKKQLDSLFGPKLGPLSALTASGRELRDRFGG